MFFSSDVFLSFIHSLCRGRTEGIFSDIMNLRDCIGLYDSLLLPQQVKTRIGGISPMGEKELGQRNFGFDSEQRQEDKGVVALTLTPGGTPPADWYVSVTKSQSGVQSEVSSLNMDDESYYPGGETLSCPGTWPCRVRTAPSGDCSTEHCHAASVTFPVEIGLSPPTWKTVGSVGSSWVYSTREPPKMAPFH